MKILIICHNLTGGGAERVAASLLNGLSSLDNGMILLSDFTQPVTYKTNSTIQRIQVIKSSNPLLRFIKGIRQIITILKKERPDVIISILSFMALEARIATWTSYYCPIIQSEHNSFERPISEPFSLGQRLKKFWLNYLYEYITVLTDADRIYLNGRFRHVEVMPNPLYLPPVNVIPPKHKTILAVGRIDAWRYKGFDILISVWNDIAFKYPDWKLRIVGAGNGDNIMYLKSLMKNPCQFEIKPYTEDIEMEYRDASIFVLSSRYEGFGLVLIEAMSQGCACIACDYKGRQSEIITDGKTGIVCQTDNKADLEDKLEHLILDDDLRSMLQRNAPAASSKYAEYKIAKRWNDYIRNIVKNNDK